MSLLAIGLGTLSIGLAGAAGYWMLTVNRKMIRLLDMQTLLRESQATHFHHLNTATDVVRKDVQTVQATMNALRAIHPEIDASLSVHQFLLHHEGDEFQHVDIGQACEVLRAIVQHQSTESSTEPTLSVNHLSLLRRLLAVFDRHQLTMTTLHLDADTAHRLGLAACHLQHYEWAEHALGVAYQLSPGHASVLEGLEHIARLRGDDDLYRHWLEARMKLTPDDPALLRAHAHLLASMGDGEAERAVRRLEALGVDTAADRSLLSGLRARAGARSEAIEAITQALEKDPDRSEDWLTYAQLLEAEEEHELALEANERCLTLDRQCGEAWALKARLLSRKQGYERDALKAVTHAVALDAGGVDSIFLKSELLALEGSTVAAEETLLTAIERQPSSGELRARVASHYLLQHRIDEAETLLKNTPDGIDHALLHTVEGRLHLAHADRLRDGTGKTDETLLQDAVEAFNGALKLNRELGVAWLGLARTQRMLKNLETASESLNRASRLLDDNNPSVACEGALLALDMGEVEMALSHVDAAEVHGQNATTAYIRGNISAIKGQLKQALYHYSDCLTADPGHIRGRLNRISVHMGLNESQKALDDADILLDLAPQLAVARVRKGDALMHLGEWELASKEFKHVLEQAPHHTHALTQLGACYMGMDRAERAEGPLNDALRQSPDHAPAWHQRGLYYLHFNKIDNALSDFEAAVRCDGNHLDARLRIAAHHHGLGNMAEAETAWRAVLSIDADNQLAKTRLSECEKSLMKSA
ncbi:MAG: tetratricopeptide repeat protein [Poseidonia sp.]